MEQVGCEYEGGSDGDASGGGTRWTGSETLRGVVVRRQGETPGLGGIATSGRCGMYLLGSLPDV